MNPCTIKIPYGMTSFRSIRTEGYLYVDRTGFIRSVEDTGHSLLFIRPRRFGKTLWLHTMRAYYDLLLAEEFDRLFDGLAIAKDPTLLKNRYFVLKWDFSQIDPRGTQDDIAGRLNRYLNVTIRNFLIDYEGHIPYSVPLEKEAVYSLNNLLTAIRRTPYRLYLMIDEYDNFANEVMVQSEETYLKLVQKDGPLKTLFKAVKDFTGDQGIDRLFLTGVSPVVMSDITSGMNICKNIYLDERFNTLCGFTKLELREILCHIVEKCGLPTSAIDDALSMVDTWYNGYKFAPDADENVYNSTLALYFLEHFCEKCRYPRQMLDSNLAADQGKLEYLGRVLSGQQVVVDILQIGQPLEIREMVDRFTLSDMLNQAGQDNRFLVSYLYYFGMLTFVGETERRSLLLCPPNMVIQHLYVEQVLKFLLPLGTDRNAANEAAQYLFTKGDIGPLLDFVEQKLFAVFSNRDYRWMNELAVKTAFMTLLFNDVSYSIFSEPEFSRGYTDLCLILRPDARPYKLFDLLFEFKYVPLKTLGLSGEQLKSADQKDIAALSPVVEAFEDARNQIQRYAKALTERFDEKLKLRTYAVVSLGFERLLGEEVLGCQD